MTWLVFFRAFSVRTLVSYQRGKARNLLASKQFCSVESLDFLAEIRSKFGLTGDDYLYYLKERSNTNDKCKDRKELKVRCEKKGWVRVLQGKHVTMKGWMEIIKITHTYCSCELFGARKGEVGGNRAKPL